MWLEIGLLHIFKEGKMFMVHTYRRRGSQRHSRNKVINNGEFHYWIRSDANEEQNYYKCLNSLRE